LESVAAAVITISGKDEPSKYATPPFTTPAGAVNVSVGEVGAALHTATNVLVADCTWQYEVSVPSYTFKIME
jgi:hypothetical protein